MHKLYQPVDKECSEPVPGNVTGSIPAWLSGNLYRNGLGLYEVGEDRYQHWLDPLAMLQCFRIADQRVTYQSRYLRSDAYNKAMEANRIVVNEFGTLGTPDPCVNSFKNVQRIRAGTYNKAMEANRIVVKEFGTLGTPDPCVNSFKNQASRFEMDEATDNTNVSFFPMNDELYTATERNFINRIDPDTLDRLEKVKLENVVAVNSGTAHPHYDADDTLHNLGNTYHGWPKTCIVRIPPKQQSSDQFPQGQVVASVPSQSKMHINYLHSFGMSENHYVFTEQPLHMNMVKVASTKLLNASLEWKPTIMPRFRILDKKTGAEVNPNIKYEADTFMFMHHINTFEDKGHIIVDIIAYKKGSVLEHLYMKQLSTEQCEKAHRNIEDPEIRRYVMPLKIKPTDKPGQNLFTLPYSKAMAKKRGPKSVHMHHELLANIGMEFPQINYRQYNTKKYRFMYGVGWHSKADVIHTLLKIDTESKSYLQWKSEHCFPPEPVFVPRPGATDEDGGGLLSAIDRTDFEAGNNAFLLFLDAKTMEEIARVEFGVPRFPKDLHGIFRPK